MILKFKKLNSEAILPTKANSSDAGFDLFSLEDKILKPGERYAFKIGLSSEIPVGFFVNIKPKSGLSAKFGIDVLAGVIDSGYRGEWQIVIINFSTDSYHFSKGDKIAQAVLLPVPEVEIVEVQELESSDRGYKAFGSSGR